MSKKRKQQSVYSPEPERIDQWWIRSHCGPGTLNDQDLCGFCGEQYRDCAQNCTESIRDNGVMGCGGAGFWCHHCNRFYPQDVCGECHYASEYVSVDGKSLIEREGKIYCVCAGYLMPADALE